MVAMAQSVPLGRELRQVWIKLSMLSTQFDFWPDFACF
jgi:hypothetical protein